MKLEKSGNRELKGTYIMGKQPCQIEGKLENNGKKFVFTYRETQASGEGNFELSPDEKKFFRHMATKRTK